MSSDDLQARKRRILYRANHRGMKETDLLLGRLAAEVVDGLDSEGVAAFERLLEVPDALLLAWVNGEEVALEEVLEVDGACERLLRRLKGFRFVPGSYGENL